MNKSFLIQNEDLGDSLEENSFSIIKEPMGNFLIGYPFNKRFNSASEIKEFFSKKKLSMDDNLVSKISKMESYGLIVVHLVGNKLKQDKVEYLYSIPSYAGGGE